MHLTADSIIEAATTILNQYGLADMTMRRVATALDVAPGALYWHVKNKQELIHSMAEKILWDVTTISPSHEVTSSDTPQAAALKGCQQLRARLLAYRDGAEVVITAMAQPESTIRSQMIDVMVRLLEPLNLEATLARQGAHALLHQVFGEVSLEQNRTQTEELLGATSSDGEPEEHLGVILIMDALTLRSGVDTPAEAKK